MDFAASFGAVEEAAGPLQHGGGLDARAPLCAYALHHPLEGCGASARQGMAAFWRSFTNGCLGHAGMAHCVRSSLLGHAVPTALSPAARSTMATSLWWSPVHGRRRTSGDHLLAAWIRCASKIGRCRLHSALRHRAGSNSLSLATAQRAVSCFGAPRRVSSRLLHGAAGHGPGGALHRATW